MAKENALAEISIAKQALTTARDLNEVLEIKNKATAIYAWATARGADEAAQIAMEIKLRAERKAGQFLIDMKEKGELPTNRHKKESQAVTLSDLKIDKIESSRWQAGQAWLLHQD